MLDYDGRKVYIDHIGKKCRCWVDEDGAIYVAQPCMRIGHHVTKRRLDQIVFDLKRRLAQSK